MVKPNWQYWSQMVSSSLWELVALSKGYEPNSVFIHFAEGFFNPDELPADMNDRLHITKNHFEEGLLGNQKPQDVNYTLLSYEKIRIEEFYRFCIQMGWELPTEFPNPALQHELRELPAYLPPFLKFALTAIEKLGLSEEANLSINAVQQQLKENWPAELADYYSDQRAYEIAKVLSPPKHDPKKRQTASKKPAGK